MGLEFAFTLLKGAGAVIGGVAGAGLGGVQISKAVKKRKAELEAETASEEAEKEEEDEG